MSKEWNDLAELESAVSANENNNNLLLIDGNNVAYRYLHRKNHASYGEEYQRTITSLAKSYNAKRTIVCFDFGKSYYRMNMLEDYKGTRSKPQTEEEQKHYDEFFAVLNELPDTLYEQTLKFRGVEADDLLAYLSINLKEEYEHIWIVSSDKDIIQLIDENVSIFSIFSRKEVTVDSLYNETALSPSQYMLSRIIEGDKGDNIIGIEGIGPKRAQALAKEYGTFDKLVDSLPIAGKAKFIQNLNAGKERLVRNEQLINLHDYHEDAISAGKDEDALDILVEI
jgi:5'-3' exonuclease